MRRFRRSFLPVLAGLLVAASARAQLTPLSRCQAALPCAIPFSLQYRPDPLIAGPYGAPSNTGFAVSLPVTIPIVPRLETTLQPSIGAAVDADIRRLMGQPPRKDEAKKSEGESLSPPAPVDNSKVKPPSCDPEHPDKSLER